MKQRKRQPEPESQKSDWQPTQHSNLIRYVPSGVFYLRARINGKLHWQSLKTNVLSVAKLRLADKIKEKRDEAGSDLAVKAGRMTFADALQVFRHRVDADPDLKEGAKVYRRKTIISLLKSWPTLEQTSVSKISKDDCLAWAERFAADYSASVYNNTVGTLRMVLDIAIEKGARSGNPARHISKRRIQQKTLSLPEPEEFLRFAEAIAQAGAWCSQECADLVQFLAYGGFRKTEAANITWADCDFDRGQIRVRITKNGEPRIVPMIPEMKTLLERMKAERPETQPTDALMKVRECQKAMDRAAKKVGMERITNHDLRHLFATRCIESGVDIPTVSRWLGHKDGGALAMKVYGHLRDHHSTAMAQKVSFSLKPKAESNAQVPLPEPDVSP
jgi:integrase